MHLADEDKILDLKDGCKTAKTHNMDPERFTCKLSAMAGKQHAQKRLYLQALPYYIEERERKQKLVTERLHGTDGKMLCPPRRLDRAIDPEKVLEAKVTHDTYQAMLNQTREKKIEYLNRLA